MVTRRAAGAAAKRSTASTSSRRLSANGAKQTGRAASGARPALLREASPTEATLSSWPRRPRGLYILGQHGGGREVLALDTGPDWKAVRDALLLLDERTLYAVLYSIWQTAASARTQAQSETQRKWSLAYVDGRIRKSRQGGQVRVYVESPLERDFRKGKVKLNAVAFNLSTKEMELA
jgi:hypothetical protein